MAPKTSPLNILLLPWKIWCALVFMGTYVILFPFFRVFLTNKNYYGVIKTTRWWVYMFSSLTGIFYNIKRRFTPDDSRGYIVCSNHTSYLDIVFMHVAVPLNIVFVGKKELTRMPFVRVFFREMHIAIDRGSTTDAHRGMSRAAQEFDAGRSPVIFPEGTVSPKAPIMRPFKNGAFKLAIEKQADIIPVTFINNYRLLDTNHFLYGSGRPGIAGVVVHPPVSTIGMQAEQVEELKQKVFEIIASALPKK